MKARKETGLKRYNTTYKQEYLEPKSQPQSSDQYAGKPTYLTPIGRL